MEKDIDKSPEINIYEDLDQTYLASDNIAKENDLSIGSNTNDSAGLDLFEDYIVTKENAKIQSNIDELNSKILTLGQNLEKSEKQCSTLENENTILVKNITSLWKTACNQLSRQNYEIKRLQKRCDGLSFHNAYIKFGKDDFDKVTSRISAFEKGEIIELLRETSTNKSCNCKKKSANFHPILNYKDAKQNVSGSQVMKTEISLVKSILGRKDTLTSRKTDLLPLARSNNSETKTLKVPIIHSPSNVAVPIVIESSTECSEISKISKLFEDKQENTNLNLLNRSKIAQKECDSINQEISSTQSTVNFNLDTFKIPKKDVTRTNDKKLSSIRNEDNLEQQLVLRRSPRKRKRDNKLGENENKNYDKKVDHRPKHLEMDRMVEDHLDVRDKNRRRRCRSKSLTAVRLQKSRRKRSPSLVRRAESIRSAVRERDRRNRSSRAGNSSVPFKGKSRNVRSRTPDRNGKSQLSPYNDRLRSKDSRSPYNYRDNYKHKSSRSPSRSTKRSKSPKKIWKDIDLSVNEDLQLKNSRDSYRPSFRLASEDKKSYERKSITPDAVRSNSKISSTDTAEKVKAKNTYERKSCTPDEVRFKGSPNIQESCRSKCPSDTTKDFIKPDTVLAEYCNSETLPILEKENESPINLSPETLTGNVGRDVNTFSPGSGNDSPILKLQNLDEKEEGEISSEDEDPTVKQNKCLDQNLQTRVQEKNKLKPFVPKRDFESEQKDSSKSCFMEEDTIDKVLIAHQQRSFATLMLSNDDSEMSLLQYLDDDNPDKQISKTPFNRRRSRTLIEDCESVQNGISANTLLAADKAVSGLNSPLKFDFSKSPLVKSLKKLESSPKTLTTSSCSPIPVSTPLNGPNESSSAATPTHADSVVKSSTPIVAFDLDRKPKCARPTQDATVLHTIQTNLKQNVSNFIATNHSLVVAPLSSRNTNCPTVASKVIKSFPKKRVPFQTLSTSVSVNEAIHPDESRLKEIARVSLFNRTLDQIEDSYIGFPSLSSPSQSDSCSVENIKRFQKTTTEKICVLSTTSNTNGSSMQSPSKIELNNAAKRSVTPNFSNQLDAEDSHSKTESQVPSNAKPPIASCSSQSQTDDSLTNALLNENALPSLPGASSNQGNVVVRKIVKRKRNRRQVSLSASAVCKISIVSEF